MIYALKTQMIQEGVWLGLVKSKDTQSFTHFFLWSICKCGNEWTHSMEPIVSASIDTMAEKIWSCIFKLSTIHPLFHQYTCLSWVVRRENWKRMDGEFWHQSVDPSGDKGAPLPPQITKETRKFNLNLNRFPFRLWRERQGFVFRRRFENYEMECIEFV